MGSKRNDSGSDSSGAATNMASNTADMDSGIDTDFNFLSGGSKTDTDTSVVTSSKDLDIDRIPAQLMDLSRIKFDNLEEMLAQPIVSEEDIRSFNNMSRAVDTANEVKPIKRNVKKGSRTLPEPTGEVRNLYVIPSLRYGLVCVKIPADAHVTKEGAITLEKGIYVPEGRWSWDLDVAKTLLAEKIQSTIDSHQSIIDQYKVLTQTTDCPVKEDTIEGYTSLCGRGKASVEKFVLGVNVPVEKKELGKAKEADTE